MLIFDASSIRTNGATARRAKVRRARRTAPAAAAVLAVVAVSGCGGAEGHAGADGVAGLLGRLKPLAEACDGPVNGYVAYDLSGSSRGPALAESRLPAVRDVVDAVAACGGHVRVVGFTASVTSTVTLTEADFATSSGTENARLIANGKAADRVADEVVEALPAAEQALNPRGTDVLGQLTLIEQYQSQRGEGRLRALLLTDGMQSVTPVPMGPDTFTEAVAAEAAQQVSVPSLTGEDRLDIVGLGKVVGDDPPPTTEYTRILTGFYTTVCERTGARCQVATDHVRSS